LAWHLLHRSGIGTHEKHHEAMPYVELPGFLQKIKSGLDRLFSADTARKKAFELSTVFTLASIFHWRVEDQ